MSYDEVKRNIWRNSISNYVRTVAGMVLGLFMFRMLFQAMTAEEFGFWSLLWNVFGYGLLLDFGFGFTAQKRVAELCVSEDWNKLSAVLSTIVFFYCAVGAVIVTLVLLGSHQLVQWFHVTPANTESFRRILVLFFAAIGVGFPMGIFPEILRGQQRINLANNVVTVALVLKFALIAAAVYWHWGFFAIMVIAVGFSIAPDFVAASFALRRLPHVRLRPRFFAWGVVGETLKFSVFAYLTTAANMVMMKTDQVVISTTLAVAAVTLYQAGSKVGEMFGQFTKQIQETLSPAAAHLHATGDRAALQNLMIQALRWCALIATPLYLLCAFYMDDLLHLLTGSRDPAPAAWWVGQTLLLWNYSTLLTHSVSKRIFMMCGHERKLMWLGIAEAAANLGLSVWLALWFRNVLGVAVGSLIPALAIGWIVLWPWMARDGGLTGGQLLRKVVLPIWGACLPMLALLAAARLVPSLQTQHRFALLALHGVLAGGCGAAGLWFLALTGAERGGLAARLWRPLLRRRAA